MAKSNLLDTSTVTFGEIVSNGKKYRVPIYQRDYSWKEENWEDLWTDILKVLADENENHYMGSIVLQKQEDKFLSIIDGQQRLATLSIIALATLKNIQDLIDKDIETISNEERKKLLMDSFLGIKDAVSLMYSSKLFLNKNNDEFYRDYLMRLKEPTNKSNLNDSNKLLWKAFQFFYEKIKKYYLNQASGENFAMFLKDKVAEKLMFIQIIVENEVHAYTVFETLNARGESLTVTDLLKNYLFSLVNSSETDLDLAQIKWTRIIDLIGLDTFPQFLRHYWNSRNDLVRQEGLFKAVKRCIKTAAEVFSLLDELQETSEIYIALSDPANELWQNDNEAYERVEELVLFNAKQCYPLLLIAYKKLLRNEFIKVLKTCSIISFRRSVIGEKNPNPLEQAYNRTSKMVLQEKIKNAKEVFEQLQGVYSSDADFKQDFTNKEIKSSTRTRKLTKYILCNLEAHVSTGVKDNWENNKITIEHILPENPLGSWLDKFDEKNINKYIHRIGNQTLLEKGLNNSCGNKSFSEKLQIYAKSKFEITKELKMQANWTASDIEKRQKELARKACSVWRIDF